MALCCSSATPDSGPARPRHRLGVAAAAGVVIAARVAVSLRASPQGCVDRRGATAAAILAAIEQDGAGVDVTLLDTATEVSVTERRGLKGADIVGDATGTAA
jgi:hypothetical protein